MVENSISFPVEEKEPQIVIKTPEKLAKSLGFIRGEKQEGWYRVFHKPVDENRKALLIFQNSKYGGEQRIIIRVNGKEYFLCQNPLFDQKIKELGLEVSADLKMFNRKQLNEGGYQKLYGFLRELEADGFYEEPQNS